MSDPRARSSRVHDLAARLAALERRVQSLEVHDVDPARVTQKLDQILTQLTQVIQMDAATQTALDTLLAQVTRIENVQEAEQTLLNGLSAQIAELKKGQTDPAVIAIIDKAAGLVSAVADKAAAAVLANTPA